MPYLKLPKSCTIIPGLKLFQVGIEECCQLVERNLFEIVIEVGMVGIGYNEQLLVVAGKPFESVLSEIA